jgi:hypothetical protein
MMRRREIGDVALIRERARSRRPRNPGRIEREATRTKACAMLPHGAYALSLALPSQGVQRASDASDGALKCNVLRAPRVDIAHRASRAPRVRTEPHAPRRRGERNPHKRHAVAYRLRAYRDDASAPTVADHAILDGLNGRRRVCCSKVGDESRGTTDSVE